MTDPQRDAPRTPPRFVPTLTEVVMLPAASAASAASAPVVPVPVVEAAAVPGEEAAPADLERVAQRVLERLRPGLDRLVSEAVSQVVHEQMEGLQLRVGQAVDAALRRAVEQALADHSPGTTR